MNSCKPFPEVYQRYVDSNKKAMLNFMFFEWSPTERKTHEIKIRKLAMGSAE